MNEIFCCAGRMLTIGHDAEYCTIYPEVGGSLSRWTVEQQDMLRVTNASSIAAGDMLGMASFPLVPYSNRIGNGSFEWDGKPIQIAKNFAPEPHSIHGIGWERPWLVAVQSDDAATLTLTHDGDDKWPWPFHASQRLHVGNQCLTLALSVRNLAPQRAPLAFGHHPYFDTDGATLAFDADAVWMTGKDALPTMAKRPEGQYDFSTPARVSERAVDHCYTGVSGPARIAWRDRRVAVEITSSPQLDAAVVYIPMGGDAFCFEPVPHISNALNLPGHKPSMPVISPGASFETTIRFQAISQ